MRKYNALSVVGTVRNYTSFIIYYQKLIKGLICVTHMFALSDARKRYSFLKVPYLEREDKIE